MAGGVFSSAKLHGITLRESADDGSDFTNPDADYRRIFLGEDGLLHARDSAGNVTSLGGSGIAEALLDAKGDLVVASAADTAARLPVISGDGSALVVASGETTGLKWLKHNHAATAAPGATDDDGDGYAVGSIWIDTTNDAAYICVDASTGAAVWNPFEAAGGAADLSAFRLSGVSDDPGTIALGTYGDEFEYTTQSAVTTAGWAATNSLPSANWLPCGSSIWLWQDETTAGRGFMFDIGSNLPDDFEVAVLLSGHTEQGVNNMLGLGVLDASGNGIVGIGRYSGVAYTMTATAYAYSSTGTSGTALTAAQVQAPHWLALRRSSATTWRFRWSADGASWTTIVASRTQTVTNARQIYIGPIYNGGNASSVLIHRLVYGTADLGL